MNMSVRNVLVLYTFLGEIGWVKRTRESEKKNLKVEQEQLERGPSFNFAFASLANRDGIKPCLILLRRKRVQNSCPISYFKFSSWLRNESIGWLYWGGSEEYRSRVSSGARSQLRKVRFNLVDRQRIKGFESFSVLFSFLKITFQVFFVLRNSPWFAFDGSLDFHGAAWC